MFFIYKCRKELGDVAKKFSDTGIEKIRAAQYQLAELIFDKWLEDKKLEKFKK